MRKRTPKTGQVWCAGRGDPFVIRVIDDDNIEVEGIHYTKEDFLREYRFEARSVSAMGRKDFLLKKGSINWSEYCKYG